MTKKDYIQIITLISSFCTIIGISITQILNGNNSYVVGTILIIVTIIAIIVSIFLLLKYNKTIKLLGGYFVRYSDRRIISQNFAKPTLRSILIFAGDLTWLETDLIVYRDLIRNANVEIKILTDTSNSTAITQGKTYGIQFRLYPNAIKAPLAISLFDTEDETECRALLVKKKTISHNERNNGTYNYWFKEYYGKYDYKVICGLKNYFNYLFENGNEL